MGLEHEFFGYVDGTASGGLHWSDSLELGDQYVELTLDAEDEGDVSELGLDLVAAMIRALEIFDARARDALVAQLSDHGSPTSGFVDRQLERHGSSLVDLLVDNSGDLAIDVLRSVSLTRVAFRPDQTEGDDPFASYEYALEPDESDELLVVTFSSEGEVVDVDDVE